jgi:cytochrome c oxidase cbb3-type subunit 3
MNKLVLTGIITTIVMLAATWLAVGGSKGGLNGDIVNSLAVAGAIVLVLATVFVVTKYVRQMQNDTATGQLADENWDGIGEYKNEVPMGWAVIFLGTMIWATWYFLAGYPVNSYSQIGEYNEDVAKHDAIFEAKHANMDAATLVEMGESVFIVQCAPCHGLTADGIGGKAANLTQRIEKEAVMHAIMNGANNMTTDFPGGMPAGLNYMFASEAEIEKVAQYIVDGFDESDTQGAALFAQGTCSGCHGDKGEGMPYAGPKLNAFDGATVASVLKDGKKGAIGAMPKFNNLTPKQIEAVGAYITDISK